MDYNELYLEWYAQGILEAARAAARRDALVPRRPPIVRPALAAMARALRARYVRWSSAASTGSKPTTARA